MSADEERLKEYLKGYHGAQLDQQIRILKQILETILEYYQNKSYDIKIKQDHYCDLIDSRDKLDKMIDLLGPHYAPSK